MHYLPPIPKQFVNVNGVPLTNGTLHVFLHGKPDYASVWAEADTDRPAENPVQLESNGAWVAFLDSNVPYDILVYDKLGFVQFSYINVVIPVVDKEYVDESVGAVQAQLDHVSDSVEANTESIAENADAIAENSRSIDENTTAISENSTAIAANTASIAANTSEISRHERDRNNPHHVTAHQVGAYTQQETDEFIAANAEAIATEIADRTDADAEIINSLEDETAARRLNDELLQQQIEEVAVQTDWDEDDSSSLAYLQNRPAPITTAEIDALFI